MLKKNDLRSKILCLPEFTEVSLRLFSLWKLCVAMLCLSKKKKKKRDRFQIKKKLDLLIQPKCFFEKELKLSWGREITGVYLLKVINLLRKQEQMSVVSGDARLPFSKAQILTLESIAEMPWLAMICRSQLQQVNAICISI